MHKFRLILLIILEIVIDQKSTTLLMDNPYLPLFHIVPINCSIENRTEQLCRIVFFALIVILIHNPLSGLFSVFMYLGRSI